MLYMLVGNCVHKKNPDGKAGRKIGCHDSREKALAHMRALYAAEGDVKEVEAIDKELHDIGLETKEIEELVAKCYGEMGEYVPWGVKSFEELDTWKKTQKVTREVSASTYAFQRIVENIMGDYDLGMNEKLAAVKELADEFAARVESQTDQPDPAHKEITDNLDEETPPVPSEDGDWIDLVDDPEFTGDDEGKARRADVSAAERKRAVAEYGNVAYADPVNKKYPIDTEEHIRAAWNYINQARNAAKYPDKGAVIKRKIIAAWKRKIDEAGPPSAKKELDIESIVESVMEKVKDLFGVRKSDKETDGFMAYKEADGSYRWLARYSNHFRDQDNPPEIISSASHQHFVERVEKGLAPLPELWIWHVKEWRIGQADWVAFDKDSGFAMAGGHSLPGAEPVFEALSKIKGIKVSHGMPKKTIVRDEKDQTIIVEHETREISPLPGWAAANKLTGFVVLDTDTKEAEMAIPADKREKLIKEWGISEDILSKIEAANQADSQKAQAEGLEHKESPPAAESGDETAAAGATEKKDPEVSEAPSEEAKTIKELEPVFAEIAAQFKAIHAKLDALEKKQASDQEALNKAVSQSPAASILSMFGVTAQSAIGNEATQVDGRTSLAKQKPAEPKVQEGRTFVPFINEILAGQPGQQR